MDIKSVLKAYGETTYTLAAKMGLAQPSVYNIVNGNPTAKKIEEVAKAIGCSPAEFFKDWEPAAPAKTEPAAQAAPADGLPFGKETPAQGERKPDLITIDRETGRTLRYVLLEDQEPTL